MEASIKPLLLGKIFSLRLFSVSLLLHALLLIPAFADQSPAGPAFIPFEKTVLPDADWLQKGFNHDATEAAADLVIIINQQYDALLRPVIAEFARLNGLAIQVKMGTCGLAAGAVLNKSAEITSFCCPPGELDRLPGLSFHTLGIYPISILVHPDNSISQLSWQQIQKIFQGEIRSWSDLGGRNELILPIARLHCKKRPGHWRLLLDHQDLFSVHTQEVGSIDDMYALIREHGEAIGYEVDDGYHSRGTKSLQVDGMNPRDLDQLLSGAYPFYRVLNLTLWAEQQDNPQLLALFNRLVAFVETQGRQNGLVPASQLRAAGWQFSGDELIGLPAEKE